MTANINNGIEIQGSDTIGNNAQSVILTAPATEKVRIDSLIIQPGANGAGGLGTIAVLDPGNNVIQEIWRGQGSTADLRNPIALSAYGIFFLPPGHKLAAKTTGVYSLFVSAHGWHDIPQAA